MAPGFKIHSCPILRKALADFPGIVNPVALSLNQMKRSSFLPFPLLYHYWTHCWLADPQGAVAVYNPRILDCGETLYHGRADRWPPHPWSPDRTFPWLRRSQLTHRRKPELPCCDDQSICMLASSKQGTFNSWPEFHQFYQSLTIKWIYVLVTPGSLPCKHSGRSRLKPWAEPHSLRPPLISSCHDSLMAYVMCP